MRTNLLLTTGLATADMIYRASVYSVDSPTAGPFGSGKITFTSTNPLCYIVPGDDAIAVQLGQISYRHLKASADVSDSKPFTIHLQNCTFDPDDAATNKNQVGKMSKANVSFSGNVDSGNKGHVYAGNAQRVQDQLSDSGRF